MRSRGFTFLVLLPSREHGPAHVHVLKAGEEIVVMLDPVVILRSTMNVTDARIVVRLVEQHWARLDRAWRGIHG